jgi:tetratricopeptide (TPR) repeat protein
LCPGASFSNPLETSLRELTGYVQRGWVQAFSDWDWEGAKASLTKAAQLEPGSATVLRYHSYLYHVLGQINEAIETQQEAISLDPLRARSYLFFGYQLYCAGRYGEAEAALLKALELNQQFPSAHSDWGQILLAQRHPLDVLSQMEKESSGIGSYGVRP